MRADTCYAISHCAFTHCEAGNGRNSVVEPFTHPDPSTFSILTLLVPLSPGLSRFISPFMCPFQQREKYAVSSQGNRGHPAAKLKVFFKKAFCSHHCPLPCIIAPIQ